MYFKWKLWDYKESGSLEQFGFTTFAVDYGLDVYLRAKVLSRPDYLMTRGDNDHLLDCLLLGPSDWFESMPDVKGLETDPYKNMSYLKN